MFDSELKVGFSTDDWKYVKDQLEKKLKSAREGLEQPDCTPEATLIFRGRIALAKEILKLPDTVLLTLQSAPTKTTR